MKIGIDQLSFYTSSYFLDMKTLARERNVDPQKYYFGIGQHQASVPPPGEDSVTLAANAALPFVENNALSDVDWLLFATETGIDQSKSAGTYLHHLLNLPPHYRVIEFKQACYGSIAALQAAMGLVERFPQKKVLVIASDIARYEIKTPGEVTQGSGAIALLISANPRIITMDKESGFFTQNSMDFWRPNYRREPIVDGKASTRQYIHTLIESWKQYTSISNNTFADFTHYCYHLPFSKMVEKAHTHLARFNGISPVPSDLIKKHIGDTLHYVRTVGNTYTAAIFIGLLSLLENSIQDLSRKKIGFFSYGSGSVGEFLSGTVEPGYREMLNEKRHKSIIEDRSELSYKEYEDFYHFDMPQDGGLHSFPKQYHTGHFRLAGLEKHKRIYEKIE